MRVGEKNFRIGRDGKPLSIALDEQGHHVVMRCWNDDRQRVAGQRQYNWRLEVVVTNGGLIARNDVLAFEAPEEGYVPGDLIDMPASLAPNEWRGFTERSYFIRFDDGIFARADVEMRAGGDHFVVWQSFLNPKAGSRNLESAVAE